MVAAIKDNWLTNAVSIPSPNCSERPPGTEVDLLVIHNISLPPGEFGTGCIDQLFCNSLDPDAHPYFAGIGELRVSSHLLIARDGSLRQYVPFHMQAWHAGESCFRGRERCNEFSIGIELEGTDELPYEDAQYQTLIRATRDLMSTFPLITSERITGHSDIAPGRKTDPGPCFDWQYYLSQLADSSNPGQSGE